MSSHRAGRSRPAQITRGLVAFGGFALAACTQQPDYTDYREAVKGELRDPASAEFRNEQIRTLWTAAGKRRTIYCAEVNANNAFGGKAGFRPVRILISTRGLDGYTVGDVWIDDEMNPGFYLDCVRPDTQRDDENFDKAFPGFTRFNQAEIDAAEPFISNDVAPEEP